MYRGASLEFITAMHTDIPYYKRDGKIWITGNGEYEKGWRYNCLDSISCADAFPKQLADLESKGNIAAYERQKALIEPLTYMMEHGIRVDLVGMKSAREEANAKIEQLTEKIHSLIGNEMNINSPKQLGEYFYGTKKLQPYMKDGKTTVNEDALKRIALKGYEEASLILQARRLSKKISTFLDASKVDSDGRIRCSYNPVGTKFSRVSSGENIFGTGTNLQNQPHDVLSYFVADTGYVIYAIDLSQIENRIVAYVGNISQMMDVFERGLDSHRQTASLIFSKLYTEVSNDPGSCVLGDGDHSERDWAKRANHAFNYGYGPGSFSLKYEVPLAQAKWIHSAYHQAYPGLAKNYWAGIERQLKETRTLTNLFGRNVSFLGKWGEDLLHSAYSCIPQGSCGDLLNERGILFTYYNSSDLFKPVELLTQVHDSMELQLPLSLSLIQHAKILIAIKNSLEFPLRWRNKEFIVPADLTVNFCLNKDVGVELKGAEFSTDPIILAKKLQHAINRLEKVTYANGRPL
jgi:DNA polymerase I-like protein with 3'-5' exonuclease and polymerase domains